LRCTESRTNLELFALAAKAAPLGMASGLRRSSGGAWLDEADDDADASPRSAGTASSAASPTQFLDETESSPPRALDASPQALDDGRYRESIHALEAEVDTLLSRAAGRGGARAKRDRDRERDRRREASEGMHLENAQLRSDVAKAHREIERLRAACASAQTDAERCARAAARAAERAAANELDVVGAAQRRDEAVGAAKTEYVALMDRQATVHSKAVAALQERYDIEREARLGVEAKTTSLSADVASLESETRTLGEKCTTLTASLKAETARAAKAEAACMACKEEALRSSKHAERMTAALEEAATRAAASEETGKAAQRDAVRAKTDAASAADRRTAAEAAAKRAENQRKSFEQQLAYARKDVEAARAREAEQRERVAELSKTNRDFIVERRKLEAREVDLEMREKSAGPAKRDERRFRGLTDLKPMDVAELPEAALGAWRRRP